MAGYGIDALFSNRILLSVLLAFLLAGTGKFITDCYKTKKFKMRSFIRPGGMPSMHNSLASTIAMSIYLEQGFSTLFFVTVLIVIYVFEETMISKSELGRQARFMNASFKKKFNGEIGHTKLEVFAGLAVGIVSAVIVWMII